MSRALAAGLERVEVRDDAGKTIAGVLEPARFTVKSPLAFGMRYRIVAEAGNTFGQRETYQLDLTTVEIPTLEGGAVRSIGPDGSVTLAFDRPVGRFEIHGDLEASVQADEKRQSIKILATRYAKGTTIPVQVSWETPSGIPLPPFSIQLTTAPPLAAELNVQGQTNLGVALPIELSFDAPLAERDRLSERLTVRTPEGAAVTGRWQWIGERRLRFRPQPHWPASSTIEVRAEPGSIRTTNGGTNEQALLGSFGTGSDRRIFVYLDAQRVAAVENGQVVRSFKVSTGKAATPTVTGSYYIYARYPRKTMRSLAKPGEPGHYVVENVPYAQYFHADYALHGAWWHNGFGRPASHGCVNIPTRTNNRRWPKSPEEAGWLYEWASLGVPVTVQRSASR